MIIACYMIRWSCRLHALRSIYCHEPHSGLQLHTVYSYLNDLSRAIADLQIQFLFKEAVPFVILVTWRITIQDYQIYTPS